MTAENQVCIRENGHRLAELGVEVESYFGYQQRQFAQWDATPLPMSEIFRPCGFCRAWTVGELGQMLRLVQGYYTQDALSTMIPHVGLLEHGVVKDSLIRMLRDPDLCAEVLIWLLENGRITAKEINEAAG